ncbi:MAG: hypothetical protein KGL39_18975 [Patescibacteria group bacterium]|nr:hypothetical protein [Patescibacteria group bacterium]
MQHEISISRLAEETGKSMSHLCKLMERGVLPKGRKAGTMRLLPYQEVKAILDSHDAGKRWRKDAQGGAAPIDWSKLL